MGEKVPAFQFYPRDYLCDPHVRAMTYEQRGIYWEAVSLCWLEGSLPADLGELAAILHVQRRKLEALWPRIGTCFTEADGRLRHSRLDREREVQAAWKHQSQEGGRRSAAARKARFGSANPRANREPGREPECEPTVHDTHEPDVNSASASASASAVCVQTAPFPAPIVRPSRRNVAFPWRVPIHGDLWAQWRVRLAAEDHHGDEAAADKALQAWAMRVVTDWGDKPTGGDDDFAFWRARFAEWRGTTKRAAASAADPPPPRLPRARDVLAAQGIPLPARKVAP